MDIVELNEKFNTERKNYRNENLDVMEKLQETENEVVEKNNAIIKLNQELKRLREDMHALGQETTQLHGDKKEMVELQSSLKLQIESKDDQIAEERCEHIKKTDILKTQLCQQRKLVEMLQSKLGPSVTSSSKSTAEVLLDKVKSFKMVSKVPGSFFKRKTRTKTAKFSPKYTAVSKRIRSPVSMITSPKMQKKIERNLKAELTKERKEKEDWKRRCQLNLNNSSNSESHVNLCGENNKNIAHSPIAISPSAFNTSQKLIDNKTLSWVKLPNKIGKRTEWTNHFMILRGTDLQFWNSDPQEEGVESKMLHEINFASENSRALEVQCKIPFGAIKGISTDLNLIFKVSQNLLAWPENSMYIMCT
eukprot:UC4_evm1s1450